MQKDSFMIVLAIFGGSLVSHIVISFGRPDWSRQLVRFHLLWTLILPLPMIGIRLFKSVFLQFLSTSENRLLKRRSLQDPSIERVLFYGAGINLSAYITLFDLNVTRNNAAMLGALDDNLGLCGRVFRDLPILGPLEYLEDEENFEKLKVSMIIVTTAAMRPARLAEIQAFCTKKGIKLVRFEQFETALYTPEK
jgi:FlaA1/EpsC-like NDP-sugar epimerase